MRNRTLILLALLVHLISVSWIYPAGWLGATARPGLVLIVLFTVLYGQREGLIMALSFGLLTDAFVGILFGLNTALYLVITFFVGAFEAYIFKDNRLTSLVMIAAATVIYYLGAYGFFFLFDLRLFLSRVFETLPIELLWNVLLGALVFSLMFRTLRYRGDDL